MKLTRKDIALILEALEMSKAFKCYGDGREVHQQAIDKVLAKVKEIR